MHRKLLFLLITISKVAFSQYQNVQWASEVLSFSSEKSNKQFSAKEALGIPNVLPNHDFNGCAWGAKSEEKISFIELGFIKPERMNQLIIVMSFGANALHEMILKDDKGGSHPIDLQKAMPLPQGSKCINVYEHTEYNVASIRLTFFNHHLDKPCNLDAVGITSEIQDITPIINLIEDDSTSEMVESNLGPMVNTKCDEIAPVVSLDGTKMFFTRLNCASNVEGKRLNSGDIYITEKKDGQWQKAKHLGPPINNAGNNKVVSVSSDGNSILVTGTYNKALQEFDDNGISISTFDGKKWSYPQTIKIEGIYSYNNRSSYYLAPNGKVLILSLEREDSKGGNDFYVSFRKSSNSWSVPKHMGNVINSAAFEFAPFIGSDNETFYFASYGFAGFGHSDMYISKRLDDTWLNWSVPQNMGDEVNGPGFDGYYRLTASGDEAYYVSSKKSYGLGDIFEIRLQEQMKPEPVVLLKGIVYDAKAGKPIKADIQYLDLETGEEMGIAVSNATSGEYQISLPHGKNYKYLAKAKGFASIEESMDLSDLGAYNEVNEDLYLIAIEVGQPITLNNVFFPRGRDTLLPSSYNELNNLVKILSDNISFKIEIAGHTSNHGDSEMNLKLSQARADAVKRYLIRQGIAENRVQTIGYGGARPIASNKFPETAKLNRRVEFTLIE